MGQERLNHAMALHTHKSRTDEVDLTSVAQQFVTQYWKTSLIAALLILRYGCVKSPQVSLAKNDFLL